MARRPISTTECSAHELWTGETSERKNKTSGENGPCLVSGQVTDRKSGRVNAAAAASVNG